MMVVGERNVVAAYDLTARLGIVAQGDEIDLDTCRGDSERSSPTRAGRLQPRPNPGIGSPP
jgi:hypothetical protein